MAYLAPIHRASSIRHAIKCHFIHADKESLVIAKSNRIEVYDLIPEGLEQVAHFAVYGRVTGLLSLRPQQSTLDHLFLGTDRYEYFTVSWDSQTGTIRNERKAHDVTDRFQRPAQVGHLYLADPGGRLLGLYLYEGIFTAIPIKRQSKGRGRHAQLPEAEIGNLDDPCPIRMNELKVINMVFLYGTSVPVIAVLYTDSKKLVHLITYELNVAKRAVKDPEFAQWGIKANNLDHGAKLLIPVDNPTGGILVIGEQVVSYFHPERTVPMKKPLHEPTSFVTHGKIDPERYLLSDELGHLYLLLLIIENNKLINMRIENLGEVCQARAIVYLDNGYVFLGSHFGDSTLVRISSKGPRIEVVQSLPNLAPISDFIVLGTEVGGVEIHQYSAGQTMILTCSGGFYDGGLRSVRSGVGIQDIGLLGEMSGVQNMWALKRAILDNGFHDTLLFSFANESRAFAFGADGEVEEVDTFENFFLDTTTLEAGNVGNDKLVQVTPFKVIVVEKATSKLWNWAPPVGAKIVMASLSGARLVVVLNGRICLLFDLSSEPIKQIANRTFENEISCIHIPTKQSGFLVVGFWMPASLALLRIADLETMKEEHLAVFEGSVPRSVMVANMEGDGPSSLFVGMADGEVISYTITEGPGILDDQKRIRLGTQTVTFEALPRKTGDDSSCVIATGERPTMVYGEEGRTVYSAITLNQASSVVAFNAEAFPDTVVVATDESVFIAKIDEARTTHTRMSPLCQFARRVAFSKEKKAYGVATIRNSIDTTTGMESSSCYIHVIDENFYDKIDAYELYPNELVESLLCASLANPDGTISEKFVVGTAIGNDSDESEHGRLLFLELGADKMLRLITELELPGACHSLAIVKGYILAGLSKSIDLYRFSYTRGSLGASIQQISSIRAATLPVSLSVYGKRVFVGDLVKGVMVLEVVEGGGEGNDKLVEVCRQYGVSWVTALEALDEDTCISADSDGNLVLLRRESTGATDEDTRRMRPLSEIRLGEMVNCIRRVNDPITQGYVVQPKAYLGTVDGGLFMLGLIHPDYFDILMKCQVNMAKVIKGIGDLDFNRYRAYNTKGIQPEEPFRFVDGELVEKFLDLDEDAMRMVIDGANDDDNSQIECTVGEMKNIVETLKRLH
ncbi:DNA damage-binding protein 1 [Orbilia oligospora]|nr:DNA damage-binding protein 1 [Orbilia oligospora]